VVKYKDYAFGLNSGLKPTIIRSYSWLSSVAKIDDTDHHMMSVIDSPELLLLLLLPLTAIEFSRGGSSPYTSTDKTNKNKYT